ncbi:IS5 family transposase [Actinosynnema sp. CA-299493]
MARGDLTDAEWAILEPLLPGPKPGRGGRWGDRRRVVDGILWRMRTGAPWRDVPERYGPWKTCYERYRRWAVDGTWARLKRQVQGRAEAGGDIDWDAQADSTIVRAHQHAAGARKGGSPEESRAAQGLGRSRGGLTSKIHTIADGRGRSLSTHVTPGQAADTKRLEALLEGISVPRPGGVGRPRKRPDSLTADKAYGSRANRASLRRRKIKAVIPQRRDQVANRLRKGSAGGRPPSFDADAYKRRNQVERGFNRRKQFRALATRYDKLALHWQATNDIVETIDWIRAAPDKPRS